MRGKDGYNRMGNGSGYIRWPNCRSFIYNMEEI